MPTTKQTRTKINNNVDSIIKVNPTHHMEDIGKAIENNTLEHNAFYKQYVEATHAHLKDNIMNALSTDMKEKMSQNLLDVSEKKGERYFERLHDEYKELAKDYTGNELKEKFAEKVDYVSKVYNKSYLETESDTVNNFTHSADVFEKMQYKKEKYMIRWNAVMDDRTREEHVELNDQCFRMDDPFILSYFPGSCEPNCRCWATYEYMNEDELEDEGDTEKDTIMSPVLSGNIFKVNKIYKK
jgi:SPP1 gp7 family putative phage head morphogenesis protein